jgi:hypothetical protein
MQNATQRHGNPANGQLPPYIKSVDTVLVSTSRLVGDQPDRFQIWERPMGKAGKRKAVQYLSRPSRAL